MLRFEKTEGFAITKRMFVALTDFRSTNDDNGAAFRSSIGKMFVDFYNYVDSETIGTELRNCFDLAKAAGATLNVMDGVRKAMLAETPQHPLGTALVNAGIIFSLVQQSVIISEIEFTSRIQVNAMIDRMMPIFEEIRIGIAETFNISDYRAMVGMSAALIQHLSVTERQLPRIVEYHWHDHYPSLFLSNRIYCVGDRAEELAAENKTVHPAFMARDIIALSE